MTQIIKSNFIQRSELIQEEKKEYKILYFNQPRFEILQKIHTKTIFRHNTVVGGTSKINEINLLEKGYIGKHSKKKKQYCLQAIIIIIV